MTKVYVQIKGEDPLYLIGDESSPLAVYAELNRLGFSRPGSGMAVTHEPLSAVYTAFMSPDGPDEIAVVITLEEIKEKGS